MKQIYLFNETSRAAVYGVGTYIRQMINSLVHQEGFSFHVININSERKEFEVEEENMVKNCYIPEMINVYNRNRYYRNIFFLLQPYIEQSRLDDNDELIFHFNFYQELPLLKELKEHYPKCKIIFSIHYMGWCFAIKSNRSYLQRIISLRENERRQNQEKMILHSFEEEKKVFDLSDRIICLAEFTKQILTEDYQVKKSKIVKIYNGLKDEAVFLSHQDRNTLKAKYHIDQNEKIVLFVGRLDDVKGVDIVINAFREVIQEDINCRLIIVGDGNYSKYLKECQEIWGKVIFTGHIEKDILSLFYQIADVGVMPSTHEQCSYVAIEMLSHGIPLITSTTTGLAEMMPPKLKRLQLSTIEEEKDVKISIKQCVDNILYILRLPKEKVQEMRNLSRKQYLAKYRLCKMEENILKVYSYQ